MYSSVYDEPIQYPLNIKEYNSLFKIINEKFSLDQYYFDHQGFGYLRSSIIEGLIVPNDSSEIIKQKPKCQLCFTYVNNPWSKVLKIIIEAPFKCNKEQIAFIHYILLKFNNFYFWSLQQEKQYKLNQIPIIDKKLNSLKSPKNIKVLYEWSNK